jgi:hypothetical protein
MGLITCKVKNGELCVTSVNRKHELLLDYFPSPMAGSEMPKQTEVPHKAPRQRVYNVTEYYVFPKSGRLLAMPNIDSILKEYLTKGQVRKLLDEYYTKMMVFRLVLTIVNNN